MVLGFSIEGTVMERKRNVTSNYEHVKIEIIMVVEALQEEHSSVDLL